MRLISVRNRNENHPQSATPRSSARKGKGKKIQEIDFLCRDGARGRTRRQVGWRGRDKKEEKKRDEKIDGGTRDRFPALHLSQLVELRSGGEEARAGTRFMLNAMVNTSQFTGLFLFFFLLRD